MDLIRKIPKEFTKKFGNKVINTQCFCRKTGLNWEVETYRNKFKNRSALRTIGSFFFSIFWFYKKGKRIEIFMSQFFGDKRWSPFICCDPCRS